jgi:hypothetical protein
MGTSHSSTLSRARFNGDSSFPFADKREQIILNSFCTVRMPRLARWGWGTDDGKFLQTLHRTPIALLPEGLKCKNGARFCILRQFFSWQAPRGCAFPKTKDWGWFF